jgi:hypothetical protein
MSERTEMMEQLRTDLYEYNAQIDVFKSGLEYLENRLYESGRSSDALKVIHQIMDIGWDRKKVLNNLTELTNGYPWELDEDEE